MQTHTEDLIYDYVFGFLDEEDTRRVEVEASADTAYAEKLAEAQKLMLHLSLLAPEQEPSDRCKEQLFAHFANGGRFATFLDRVSSMFAFSVDEIRNFFAGLDDESSWDPGPTEGLALWLHHGEPVMEGGLMGFVRMQPGVTFPYHRHLGQEHLLVLSGGYRNDMNGNIYWPGDDDFCDPETEHTITCVSQIPCIAAFVIREGMEFPGFGE